MSPGRSNKPLFEVLSQHPPRGINPPQSSHGPPAQAAPSSPAPSSAETEPKARPGSMGQRGPVAEPKPRPAPSEAATPSRPSRLEPARPVRSEAMEEDLPEADAPPRPVVTIPLSTVYSAVALAGMLILIAWIGGHTMGKSSAESEFKRGTTPPDALHEPVDAGGTGLEGLGGSGSTPINIPQRPIAGNPSGTTPTKDPAKTTLPPAGGNQIQPSANGTILSAAGLLEVDPREAGLNYLELGTFGREMTQSAIDFLAANSVPSIGVPQPGGQYRLVSVGLGIPGGQWSAMAAQRTAHQDLVRSIGTRWVRDQQGGSDFTQTQWTKYQP